MQQSCMEIMLHTKFCMQHCCIVYVDLLHATKLYAIVASCMVGLTARYRKLILCMLNTFWLWPFKFYPQKKMSTHHGIMTSSSHLLYLEISVSMHF